jgi:hypothetical protein
MADLVQLFPAPTPVSGNNRPKSRASAQAPWRFGVLPPLIGVINSFNQSKSGDGLMQRNVFALFGIVAVLLTATVALTVSRATLSAGGVGSLKCYDKGGIEKAC